jgi:N-acetylglucosaminyl-diphospho-decaprenol L-rhamnosyltransferase
VPEITSMGTEGAPKLSIIIVAWNICDVLRNCLKSLLRESLEVSNEVIVFDNGSSDGTPDMVAAEFPSVMLMRNNENLGFAKGNNQAIKFARGEYILLLNSDTVIIDPGVFTPWVAFMDAHPEAGISGCRLLFPDRTHQVGDAGYRPSPATLINHVFFLTRLYPRVFKGFFVSSLGSNEEVEVDWICGADLLVRRSILSQVGLLDEKIFIYAEDVEWGCRIRSFGHKAFYLPNLRIVHLQGATTGKYPETFSGMDLRNLRELYLLLNPGRSTVFYDLMMSLGFLMRFLLYALMLWRPADYRAARVSRMYRYFRLSLARLGSATGTPDMSATDRSGTL